MPIQLSKNSSSAASRFRSGTDAEAYGEKRIPAIASFIGSVVGIRKSVKVMPADAVELCGIEMKPPDGPDGRKYQLKAGHVLF